MSLSFDPTLQAVSESPIYTGYRSLHLLYCYSDLNWLKHSSHPGCLYPFHYSEAQQSGLLYSPGPDPVWASQGLSTANVSSSVAEWKLAVKVSYPHCSAKRAGCTVCQVNKPTRSGLFRARVWRQPHEMCDSCVVSPPCLASYLDSHGSLKIQNDFPSGAKTLPFYFLNTFY